MTVFEEDIIIKYHFTHQAILIYNVLIKTNVGSPFQVKMNLEKMTFFNKENMKLADIKWPTHFPPLSVWMEAAFQNQNPSCSASWKAISKKHPTYYSLTTITPAFQFGSRYTCKGLNLATDGKRHYGVLHAILFMDTEENDKLRRFLRLLI